MFKFQLISIFLVSFCLFTDSLQGTDIHVPGDYATIQEAVDGASNGDTIFVAAGTYYENVQIVSKSIHLLSANSETTEINASTMRSAVSVTESDQVTISGFTLKDSGVEDPYSGIRLDRSDQFTLSGNRFYLNEKGIFLNQSDNGLIKDNIFGSNKDAGVWAEESSDNRIEDNYFPTGSNGSGIVVILRSNRNTVSGNYIYDCDGYGVFIGDGTMENAVTGNRIDDGYYTGIFVAGFNSTVSKNIVTRGGREGISVNHAEYIQVTDNTVESCSWSGIDIDNCDYIVCSHNRIAFQKWGVKLVEALGCSVIDNLITDNSRDGIQLYYSQDNLITENVIAHSGDYGVALMSDVAGNQVYHNSFMANQIDAYDDEGGNTWDNGDPSGGNFWSDYSGEDLDGDGLGDTPVVIDGTVGNSDGYPLMIPFGGGILWASTYLVFTSQPGSVQLNLEAAEANALRYYFIMGSLTGTDPGIPLPGGQVELPLTWDNFSDMIWQRYNTPMFNSFLGQLDANGKATAQFLYQNPIPAKFLYRTIYFAYCLADPGPFDYVSLPLSIQIVE